MKKEDDITKPPNAVLIPRSWSISHIQINLGLFATTQMQFQTSLSLAFFLFLLLRHLKAFCCRYSFFSSGVLFPLALNYASIFFYLAPVLFNWLYDITSWCSVCYYVWNDSHIPGRISLSPSPPHLSIFPVPAIFLFSFSLFSSHCYTLPLSFYFPIFLSVSPCLCAYWSGDTRLRQSSWSLWVHEIANNTASRETSCC